MPSLLSDNQARKFYASEDLGLDLTNTVYALDSTTIDLCLSVFPRANFRTAKAAKLYPYFRRQNARCESPRSIDT